MTIEQLRERRRSAAEHIQTIEADLVQAETDFAMTVSPVKVGQKVTWNHNGAVRFGVLKGVRAVINPKTKAEDLQFLILNVKKDGTEGLEAMCYQSSTKDLRPAE